MLIKQYSKRCIFLFISVLTSKFLMFSDVCFSDEIILPEIVVTSQRSARFLAVNGCETTILTRDDMKKFHVSTLPELLQLISVVTLVQRGSPSGQADLSIRGSSYEGVVVLVNGINVRDPQTGHFTMDVPINPDTIEKVEILSGGGSTLYGSQASGGVINIVTRSDSDGVSGKLAVGSHASKEASAGFGGTILGADYSLHVRRLMTDGFYYLMEKAIKVSADIIKTLSPKKVGKLLMELCIALVPAKEKPVEAVEILLLIKSIKTSNFRLNGKFRKEETPVFFILHKKLKGNQFTNLLPKCRFWIMQNISMLVSAKMEIARQVLYMI